MAPTTHPLEIAAPVCVPNNVSQSGAKCLQSAVVESFLGEPWAARAGVGGSPLGAGECAQLWLRGRLLVTLDTLGLPCQL